MRISIIILFGIFFNVSCKRPKDDNNENQERLKQYIESIDDLYDLEKYISKDKFLFVEVIEYQTAKIIENNHNTSGIMIPLKFIDFPTYSFDDSIKQIETWDKEFKYDKENTKLIIGKGVFLGERRGSGGFTRLHETEYLPYFNGETGIYQVDSLGAIYLRHKNIYYKINIGETLVDSSFFNIKLGPQQIDILRVKQEYHISNHGLLNIDAISYDTIRNR